MLEFPAAGQLHIRTSAQAIPAKFVPAGLLGRARIPGAGSDEVDGRPSALTVVANVLVCSQDHRVSLS
jgi:hypothetical protein